MTELITHTNNNFEGIFKGVWVNPGNVPTDIPPFPERKQDILTLLNNLPEYDFMGLTELRDNGNEHSINEWLANLCGSNYDCVKMWDNAMPKRFAIGLVYNKNKLFVSQVKYEYINTGTSKVNRQLLCVKLSPITNGIIHNNNSFWVLLTHLHIPKDENERQTLWIKENCSEIVNHEPHIIMMDSNWFHDTNADNHLYHLTDCYEDVFIANGSKDLDSERKIISTFVGFENDPFKKKDIWLLNDLYEGDKMIDSASVLDRVLLYTYRTQKYEISNTRICTRKINDKYVCDHLPLLFDLSIN
jgi:endonuclease/exonuclease/phosphatase family metal-dependent hydrolase